MDARLAILLAASALVAVSFGYFVASLRRARRTGKDSAASILPPPLDTTAPEPEPAAAPETLPVVTEYRMVAPVELSFADSIQRVGIRPGTATFLKYQRLAAVLLNDLKRSRQG